MSDQALLQWHMKNEDRFTEVTSYDLSNIAIFPNYPNYKCKLEFLKDITQLKILSDRMFLKNLPEISTFISKHANLHLKLSASGDCIDRAYLVDIINTHNYIVKYKLQWSIYQPLTLLTEKAGNGYFILTKINDYYQSAYLTKVLFCTNLWYQFKKFN